MGAQLWYRAAPWFPNPDEALRALQAEWLAEYFPDLPGYLRTEREGARELVRRHEAAGDPYELLDMYRRKLALLEEVGRRGVPDDTATRVQLVRDVTRLSGAEGIGGVMDVTFTAGRRGVFVAEVLSDEETRRLTGAERPTRRQAEAAVYRIHAELGRGECVCFPFFADGPGTEPAGWYFVGNTVD